MLLRVSGCCNPRGCERFFSQRFARRMARRYRKKGLDKTALVIVEFLGRGFRSFAHPPSKMLTVVEQGGFRQTLAHRGVVWQVAGLER